MAYITQLYGWYDPGWTEQSPVRLRRGAQISTTTADVNLNTDLHPSAERLFSEFRISVSNYHNFRNLSYIRAEIEMNNGSNVIVYGYVDSVDIVSDTSSLPMLSVKWHPDHWETFKASATLGYGHLLRRATGDHPLQGYSSVRRKVSSQQSLFPEWTIGSETVWWVVLAHTETVNNFKVMEFDTYPIVKDGSVKIYGATTASSGDDKDFPNVNETAAGYWDEYLGFSPNAITGAWISPVPPFGYSALNGAGTVGSPYYVDDPTTTWWFEPNGQRAYWRMMRTIGDYEDKFPEETRSITSVTSDERNPLIACGFDGEPLHEFPVGVTLQSFGYRMVLDALECSISVRFNGLASRADGLNATIPCLSLDLTENAWSEYNYSGQREYDIDSRNIASTQAMAEKAISGATQGFIMGGFNPAGAGLSAVAGAVGGAVQGGLDLAVFNPMMQNTVDKQRSKQTAGILLSGGGLDAVVHGETPKLKVYSFDTVSEDMATASDSYHGYAVDLFVGDLGSIIDNNATGFWQAEGVNVGGSIPAQAKSYITELLKRGVYLI